MDKYHYRPLDEPVAITDQDWPKDVLPLVHVRTLTYMHKEYIRDCIEGILMQKTTFPVRVLIHDDASTDKTADIVREYEMKYPDLISGYYQTENSYSQKNIEDKRRLRAPFDEMCIGKYEALCEGDDFWIDPLKLQKQVVFLENNPEFGLVHGDSHKFYHEEDQWVYHANKYKANINEPASKEELFYGIVNLDYTLFTATVLYRKELLNRTDNNRKVFLMGDSPRWLELSQHTRFKYMDETFAVYRIKKNSLSNATDLKKQLRFILSMMEMRVYYCRVIGYEIKSELKNNYNNALLRYMLLDPAFKPEYEMMDPTRCQIMKINLNQKPIFNLLLVSIFKAKYRMKEYLKKMLRKTGVDSLSRFRHKIS